MVEAFRADTASRRKRAGAAVAQKCGDSVDGAAVTKAVLQEHGYPMGAIEAALRHCGHHVQKCVEYCLRSDDQGDCALHQTPSASAQEAAPSLAGGDETSILAEESFAFQTMMNLGYDATVITKALEDTGFSFQLALKTVLFGGDLARLRHGGNSFRRQGAKKTASAMGLERLADLSVRGQYERRSREELGSPSQCVDLGQYAHGTTGACFWLSLAAGLSRTAWRMPEHGNVSAEDADVIHTLLLETSRMTQADMDVGCQSRALNESAVGRLAYRLRRLMCHGDQAILLRRDILSRIFAAFAALAAGSAPRSMNDYKRWVARLATTEYADELVVQAVVHTLRIHIRIVPFTPATARAPWYIPTYRCQGGSG